MHTFVILSHFDVVWLLYLVSGFHQTVYTREPTSRSTRSKCWDARYSSRLDQSGDNRPSGDWSRCQKQWWWRKKVCYIFATGQLFWPPRVNFWHILCSKWPLFLLICFKEFNNEMSVYAYFDLFIWYTELNMQMSIMMAKLTRIRRMDFWMYDRVNWGTLEVLAAHVAAGPFKTFVKIFP